MQIEALLVRRETRCLTLHLRDLPIVRYSPENDFADDAYELFDMRREYDFVGYLWTSRQFFDRFRVPNGPMPSRPRRISPKHCLRTIATSPGSPTTRSTRHMCLVQYLRPFGNVTDIATHGHLHTLKEFSGANRRRKLSSLERHRPARRL